MWEARRAESQGRIIRFDSLSPALFAHGGSVRIGGPHLLKLIAILNKISTTVDGGWRITLDIDQSQCDIIMQLSQLRDQAIDIDIHFPEPDQTMGVY